MSETAPANASPGVDEDVFLAVIREALADRGKPVDLPEELDDARIVGADADVVSTFIKMATAAGMKVHREPSRLAAAERVESIVQEVGSTQVLVSPESMPARDEIMAALESRGVTFVDADEMVRAFDADVGITGVSMAVAETGSLIVESGPRHRRMASLAVPIHVAVMSTDQIVPDLLDWGASCPDDMPANVALITGPSKTADIELTLVTGVHGPAQVHIILVESADA